MYLVGARFDRLDAANAVIHELRRKVQVEPGGLGLQPLGSLRYDRPTSGLVVAGRFARADVGAVLDIMRGHGGEIVFKRAEWRTPRPLSGGGEPGLVQRTFTRLRT
jgi:hypothetical protein